MSAPPDSTILAAWHTNSRVTRFLVDHLPPEIWPAAIPGMPRRTFRGLAAHIHNARCAWVRKLGREHHILAPPMVDRNKVQRRQLVSALDRSAGSVAALLLLGLEHDGHIPPSRGYVWRNLPLDVGHVMAYLVAHEGHHRGQIVLAARQLGHRLPARVINGLWQWTKLAKEG